MTGAKTGGSRVVRVGLVWILPALVVFGVCSCAKIAMQQALLKEAGKSDAGEGGYEASIVSYDEQTRQATVEIRDKKRAGEQTFYRWYQFDGTRWEAMPMTAVRAPTAAKSRPRGAATPSVSTNRVEAPAPGPRR